MKPEAIVEALNAEISKLNEHPIDEYSGDTLSRVAVRLAAYKAGLGNYVSTAKGNSWRAKKALDEAKANAYKELRSEGVSQGDAKEQKYIRCEKEYTEFIEAQELEDKLVGLSFNISDLIDAIKSRLIHQQMELKESQVH